MSEVIPLHKCGRCGKASDKELHLTYKGNPGGDILVRSCEECYRKTMDELHRVRPVFSVMRELKIDEDIISDVMSYLLDRISDYTPEKTRLN